MTDEVPTPRFKTEDEVAELMSDVLPIEEGETAAPTPEPPPPAAEPADTEAQSEAHPPEPTPAEEAPPQATEEDWKFNYRVNHEDREIDLAALKSDESLAEEVRSRLQKGEDYDRVKEQVENLRALTEAQKAHNETIMRDLMSRGLVKQGLDGSYQWADLNTQQPQTAQPTTPAPDDGDLAELKQRLLEQGDTKAAVELIERMEQRATQRVTAELTAHQQRQQQAAEQQRLAAEAAKLIKSEIDANAAAFKLPNGEWDQTALQNLMASTQQFVQGNPTPQVVNQARQHIRAMAAARQKYAEAIRTAAKAEMVTPPAKAPPVPGASGGGGNTAPTPVADKAIPPVPDNFDMDSPQWKARLDAIWEEVNA